MFKILNLVQKNLVFSIPIFMILGIIYGNYADTVSLKMTIMPLTFLMVYPMMVNLQLNKILSKGNTNVQIIAQVINFAVIPFIAYGLGIIFFNENPYIRLGLLLTSLLPTSGMTISWTGFANGNVSVAIKMTVLGLITGSLATPIYANWLLGTEVIIPLMDVFKQIILIVFLPMILGYITQVIIIKKYGREKYNNQIKQKFPPMSTIGVLGIVFVAMALKAETIMSSPTLLISFLTPLILLYLFNFIISTLIGKLFFNRGDAIALVYGTVMRNLSIALAIAMTVFQENGSEIAIIIALAYIIQVQAAAWYVKFTDRIFGKNIDLR